MSQDELSASAVDDLYRAMESSGLNSLVGGGTPKGIGQANLRVAVEHLRLRENDRVLDLGCGCGRAAVPLAEYLKKGEVVGVDIVHRFVDFCNREVRRVFPNSRFFTLADSNPMYDGHNERESISAISLDRLKSEFAEYFDAIVAFSVFTHFDPTMAERYLRFMAQVLKPSGGILITAFIASPWGDQLSPADGGFRDADPSHLTKTVFSLDRIAEAVRNAGLRVMSVHFGARDIGVPGRLSHGAHGHDLLVFAKPQPIGLLARLGPDRAIGWVWKPTVPNERVSVSVIVNGSTVATTVADVYRADLERARIGDGRHAFDFALPMPPKAGDVIQCVVPELDYEIPLEKP